LPQKAARIAPDTIIHPSNKNKTMGFFDFLFGKKKKMTLEEADRVNEQYLAENPVPKDDENAMMRQATKLMSSKQFDESMALYQEMADKFPGNRGLYLSQVGVAHYFKGDLQEAFDTYVLAMEAGCDKDMSEDNIWEAAEEMSKLFVLLEDGSVIQPKHLVEKYLELFPSGKYVKKAKKVLESN
jgi:tetratricopeptide (TPR) repeat protein